MAATPLFIQAQSFVLQASGASSGDTTIVLQSFKLSDGSTNITTAMIGSQCYGTLEPNNGTQEEAIQFTGVTQNANGTATLTGVSSVGFISPYTVTSGLSKSHAGGVTFILSNEAAFYGNIMTFINGVVASGAALATTTTAGISKMATAPASPSNPIAVGDNDPRLISSTNASYINSIVNTAIPYAIATGTSSAFTATLASSVSSLASGTTLNFLVPTTNASGVTLNVNSLGAKNIKKNASATLASGDIVAGQIASVSYDGTNFQLISDPASSLTKATSGLTTHDLSSASSTVIPHGLGVLPKYARLSTSFVVAPNTNFVIATFSEAIYTGGTVSSARITFNAGTSTLNNGGPAQTFDLFANGGSTTGTITVDSTNITIAWSISSSPTGTANILWEAFS